jgi:hypothetical protein
MQVSDEAASRLNTSLSGLSASFDVDVVDVEDVEEVSLLV